MALIVTNLKRKFVFEEEDLEDPNPNMSIEEVQGFYSLRHPELTTATVDGPKIEGDTAVYEFNSKLGTKG